MTLGLVVLFSMLALFYQFQTELDLLEQRLLTEAPAAGGQRLQAIDQHMGHLRDRLHGLMADSLELRLKSLERRLSMGHVNPDDLVLMEALKADLKTLESYASTPGAAGLEYATAEHPRYQADRNAPVPAIVTQGELLREISRLRTLLYLCLTGLVAGGALFVGRHWLARRKPVALTGPLPTKPALLARRRRPGSS